MHSCSALGGIIITCVSDEEDFAKAVYDYLYVELEKQKKFENGKNLHVTSQLIRLAADNNEIHVEAAAGVPKGMIKWILESYLKSNSSKFEPRNGCSWRYIHRDENGNEYAFHGVNHEVTRPERIISTFEFEGLPEPGHVALETATFEELAGGKTNRWQG